MPHEPGPSMRSRRASRTAVEGFAPQFPWRAYFSAAKISQQSLKGGFYIAYGQSWREICREGLTRRVVLSAGG